MAIAAPLDKASMPRAPLPANKSSTLVFSVEVYPLKPIRIDLSHDSNVSLSDEYVIFDTEDAIVQPEFTCAADDVGAGNDDCGDGRWC